MNKNKIHIGYLEYQKSREKLKDTKETNNYIETYSGVEQSIRTKACVMIMVHKSLKSSIISYTYWNERIIQSRLITFRRYLTVLDVYVPAEGIEDKNIKFYEKLQHIVDKVPASD